MTDLRTLLAEHIQTKIQRANKVFPGAYIVALGAGPSLVVFGPSGITLPETYSFEVKGETHTVPVKHSVQSGVDQEMLDRLKNRKANESKAPEQKAA